MYIKIKPNTVYVGDTVTFLYELVDEPVFAAATYDVAILNPDMTIAIAGRPTAVFTAVETGTLKTGVYYLRVRVTDGGAVYTARPEQFTVQDVA